MKRAITFSFDSNYHPWAEGLIKTCHRHAPDFDIYPRYVTTQNDSLTHIADVPLIVDHVDLSCSRDRFKSFPNDFHLDFKSIGNYSRLLASDLMIYTNHSKFFTIVDLLEDNYDIIVAVNCDFLFIDDVNILMDQVLKLDSELSGSVFANYETEHKDIQEIASIGEPATIDYFANLDVVQKPADDDFLIITGNTASMKNVFKNIKQDLLPATTGGSEWNDDGNALAKHTNECREIKLQITPLKEFQKCCLINLDHLYTTPIELFKQYPKVIDDIKLFYNREDDRLDIQVHEQYFTKLKDLNPDLYLPRFPRGHDPESGAKWDFFEEEIFIHIKKSAAFLYYNHLNGERPGLTGLSIHKTPEYNYEFGEEIKNWSDFLYEIKL